MKQKLAVITGADGGMGMEITRAVATAGYKVIMACRDPEIAEEKRQLIMRETGNIALEIVPVNLASLSSTASFANELLQRGEAITLLMNNAGTMETRRCITEDGLERTVSVNYVAPYLLTRKLLPLMGKGSRIVNMVSCTYAIGKLDFPDFFLRGKKGAFWRIPHDEWCRVTGELFHQALYGGTVGERDIVAAQGLKNEAMAILLNGIECHGASFAAVRVQMSLYKVLVYPHVAHRGCRTWTCTFAPRRRMSHKCRHLGRPSGITVPQTVDFWRRTGRILEGHSPARDMWSTLIKRLPSLGV